MHSIATNRNHTNCIYCSVVKLHTGESGKCICIHLTKCFPMLLHIFAYFFLCLQALVKHIITIGIKSIAKTPIILLEVYLKFRIIFQGLR